MRVDLFDFELPPHSIASRPVEPRDCARLLIVNEDSSLEERRVFELTSLLRVGDVMVFNDIRVIPAQLRGVRLRDTKESIVEVTLHKRVDLSSWRAFVRPAKKILVSDRLVFFKKEDNVTLDAYVAEKYDFGEILLKFDKAGGDLDQALHAIGYIPLPPYIHSKRPADARDCIDYQTIYAREEGGVAAPTAGLHFTHSLFDSLEKLGVQKLFVTLHVGAGTFLPVRVDDTQNHKMHAEKCFISKEVAQALNKARARGNRIIAVGTTSLRLLESAASSDGTIHPWSGDTDVFITPGYKFKTADILMTNFHLPRSTLFMLVSAFSGLDSMHKAYQYALSHGYRFYSYGDACLLFRSTNP